jgi:hypothetical protein
MRATIKTSEVAYNFEKAVEIAAEMNEVDDWTYTPTNPIGEYGPYSKIEIHDEDGEFVGYFSI